jgi:hypothetical protein
MSVEEPSQSTRRALTPTCCVGIDMISLLTTIYMCCVPICRKRALQPGHQKLTRLQPGVPGPENFLSLTHRPPWAPTCLSIDVSHTMSHTPLHGRCMQFHVCTPLEVHKCLNLGQTWSRLLSECCLTIPVPTPGAQACENE